MSIKSARNQCAEAILARVRIRWESRELRHFGLNIDTRRGGQTTQCNLPPPPSLLHKLLYTSQYQQPITGLFHTKGQPFGPREFV